MNIQGVIKIVLEDSKFRLYFYHLNKNKMIFTAFFFVSNRIKLSFKDLKYARRFYGILASDILINPSVQILFITLTYKTFLSIVFKQGKGSL